MASRKKAVEPPLKYTVLRDTREQKGWIFDPSEACVGTTVQTLKTGDYSLLGYEHLLTIERKGSVVEFVQNITKKDKWAAFKAELERMESYPAAFIVCEFTFDDVMRYPEGSGLPWAARSKVRISPQYYLKRLLEIELHFKARVQLVGPHKSREYVSSLFKRVVERWPTPPPASS